MRHKDLRADLDGLEDQIAETEQQLAVIERDLDREQGIGQRLAERAGQVRNQPLLSKEAARIEQARTRQKDVTRTIGLKRDTLRERREDLRARIAVLLAQAESRREQIEKQAEIHAGFEGLIDRLQREAGASECILRIIYRFARRERSTG